MSVTEVRPVGAIPPGWYPDPVDAAGLRWWSGENWTEHTTTPPPQQPTHVEPAYIEPTYVEPAYVEPELPDLARFSRDPLVTGQPASVAASTMHVVRGKDPYRERNVVSFVALGAALLGLFGFVFGQIFELPDLVLYLIGGAPFSLATLAVVFAIRTGRGMAVAVIAAVLCLVNVGMVAALSATAAREDLSTAVEENTVTFEQALEQSVLENTNTLDMPALAVSADCPDIPVPPAGSVTDCTVTLEDGDRYLVHVTSEDGLGGMSMELVDVPIGPGDSTNG